MSISARMPFMGFTPGIPDGGYRSTRSVAPGANHFQVAMILRITSDANGQVLASSGVSGGANAWHITVSDDGEEIEFQITVNKVGGAGSSGFPTIPRSFVANRYIPLLFDVHPTSNFASLSIAGATVDNSTIGGSADFLAVPGSRLTLGNNDAADAAFASGAIQAFGYATVDPNPGDISTAMASWMEAYDLVQSPPFFDNRWSLRKSGLAGLPAVWKDLDESADTPVNGLVPLNTVTRDLSKIDWGGYYGRASAPS